jgi:hypothetical protein
VVDADQLGHGRLRWCDELFSDQTICQSDALVNLT